MKTPVTILQFGIWSKSHKHLLKVSCYSNPDETEGDSTRYELENFGDNIYLVPTYETAHKTAFANNSKWYCSSYDSPCNSLNVNDLEIVEVTLSVTKTK